MCGNKLCTPTSKLIIYDNVSLSEMCLQSAWNSCIVKGFLYLSKLKLLYLQTFKIIKNWHQLLVIQLHLLLGNLRNRVTMEIMGERETHMQQRTIQHPIINLCKSCTNTKNGIRPHWWSQWIPHNHQVSFELFALPWHIASSYPYLHTL